MEFAWTGRELPYLDERSVQSMNGVVTGCFGGSRASKAIKNEDALYVLQDEEGSWTFTALLDAHNSSQSSEAIVQVLKDKKKELVSLIQSERAFFELEPYFASLFSDPSFLEQCRNLTGETSCLLCLQKGQYLWWFSVGDCLIFLLHPELARFKQYALNQRQFYEWVGQVNSFELPIPCYTTGRRQLRIGRNVIVLLTDGVLDTDDRYFQDHAHLYDSLYQENELEENVRSLLDYVAGRLARDSATIVSWATAIEEDGLYPSNRMDGGTS